VESHWNRNAEKFEEPEVEPLIKKNLKEILPIGLGDDSSKIRTVVAYSIAAIAHWDWPEAWPDLFNILIKALDGNGIASNGSATSRSNAIHGALETLTDIVQEVTDIQMPQIAPSIFPQMYKIFIDPQNYSIKLRKRSIEIFATLAGVVSEMSDYDSVNRQYVFFSFLFKCYLRSALIAFSKMP
jgi:importin-9